MQKNFIYILLALVLTALVVFGYVWINKKEIKTQKATISNFEECLAAGNSVQESYPRRCSADGKIFTEDIGNILEKQDLIFLTSPLPNEVVKSPLPIKGEAVGSWFFEGSFPVRLIDDSGKVLGTGLALTKADWMTDNFVPFEVELNFTNPTTIKGKLILEKDNPSGLPENSDQLEIPVKFK